MLMIAFRKSVTSFFSSKMYEVSESLNRSNLRFISSLYLHWLRTVNGTSGFLELLWLLRKAMAVFKFVQAIGKFFPVQSKDQNF